MYKKNPFVVALKCPPLSLSPYFMHISSYIRRRTVKVGKGSGNEEKKRASHKLLGVETVDSSKILNWTLSGEAFSHIFFSFDFDPKMSTSFIQDRVLRIRNKVQSDHTPRLSTSQLAFIHLILHLLCQQSFSFKSSAPT